MDVPSNGTTTIALLEDDKAVRIAVTLLLEAQGIHVIAGSSGTELADQIATSGIQPHLLVADYLLGTQTALDEVPKVTALCAPDAKVVITTGDTSPDTQARIAAQGWGLLIKPYRPEDLLSNIEQKPEEAV